jgi:hypothetical protein
MTRLQTNKVTSRFEIKTVSENTVRSIIRDLSNSNSFGYDTVTANILKTSVDVLVSPLTFLINASISSGEFPSPWKVAEVVPLHKRGPRDHFSNYRPISLLSVVSKVLEKAVYHQIADYAEKYILPASQHGFRHGRSTTSALLSAISEWTERREENKVTGVILFDLSAAFDLIDCEILSKKLKHYGFGGCSVAWINSFLRGRRFRVRLDGEVTCDFPIEVGAPQGSVLAPLLFLIFVADLHLWLPLDITSFITSFADDTTVSVSASSEEVLQNQLTIISDAVLSFIHANMLVANVSKTELMVIRKSTVTNKSLSIKVGDCVIAEKDCVKLLGITISQDLKWSKHVTKLLGELHQRTGIIRRLKFMVPRMNLKPVVQGLVVSKIMYCLPLFASVRLKEDDPHNSLMNDLQVSLNNTMRVALGVKLSDKVRVSELCAKSGIDSVNHLAARSTLQEVCRCKFGNIPSVSQKIVTSSNRMTRSIAVGNINLCNNTSTRRNVFLSQGAQLWNIFPPCDRPVQSDTKSQTRKKIDKFIRKNITLL